MILRIKIVKYSFVKKIINYMDILINIIDNYKLFFIY